MTSSMPTPQGLTAEILRLKAERKALILAHNYQRPEIQDLADFTGDSLGLSRKAQETDAEVIVFCGVHFMAETASILNPEKTVLLPDLLAGCSMADMISAEQLLDLKEQHPGALVVSYVNTTAAVKAESDICCTSSNATEVVASIPADREVLFLPDRHLGAHVQRVTGRANLRIWQGQCHVHEGIGGDVLRASVRADPTADVLVHPECACATSALNLVASGEVAPERVRIMSTGGMLDEARRTGARRVIVATETGMLHQLRRANPGTVFDAVSERAVCPYMKMITAAKLLRCLREGRDEISVDDEVADRARSAVERMIAIGAPGGARVGGAA